MSVSLYSPTSSPSLAFMILFDGGRVMRYWKNNEQTIFDPRCGQTCRLPRQVHHHEVRLQMHIKNIGVYWKFKNVLKGVNDNINIITGGVNVDPITFGEGYWSFNMISERLGESNIQLERNRHDNTCKIRSTKQLNF